MTRRVDGSLRVAARTTVSSPRDRVSAPQVTATSVPTSRSRRAGATRARIVELSLQIIEDEGAEHLTIRRLAAMIDRTQPAVYAHFSSKDEILRAVVVEGFSALVERLARAGEADRMSLAALARAYVDFGLERPRLYQIMFVAPSVIAFAVAETPAPARTAFRLLATAVAGSTGDRARVATQTEVVWAALHGLVMLTITERLRPALGLRRSRLDVMVAGVLGVIAPDAERGRRKR